MATLPHNPAPSSTMRRDEPTRIEGFSDAVFGFSLTLLAFSLEVPSSIEELRLLAVAQLVPTLAAFAGMSGIVYMIMGPAHGFHGARMGRARERLLAGRATTPEPPKPAEPRDRANGP